MCIRDRIKAIDEVSVIIFSEISLCSDVRTALSRADSIFESAEAKSLEARLSALFKRE